MGSDFRVRDPQLLTEFYDLLNNPIGYVALSNFLMRDLASERLLFWKDVENFKQAKLTAAEIYKTYLAVNAPLWVQLSPKLLEELDVVIRSTADELLQRRMSKEVKLLERDKLEDVLSEAQKEVMSDMLNKSCRFRETEEYGKLREVLKVSEKESLKLVHQVEKA